MNDQVIEAFTRMSPAYVRRELDYWQRMTPRDPRDQLRRWLFAFCSVHTTWQNNVRGYDAVKDLAWLRDKALLLKRLEDSRVGLHNMRTAFIWKFKKQFLMCPDFFTRHAGESWIQARNRIHDGISGLGYAKTSFAMELCFPLEAELVCLDVHMLRLYGRDDMNGRSGNRFHELYHTMESDWVERALTRSIPSYIARCVYWDRLHRKRSSRYWSRCLE